jgi:hypothetical protein
MTPRLPLALFSLLAFATTASANPRALPYTYPTESLPKGMMELEQYVDLTPVPNYSITGATNFTTVKYTLTTEYEYGITRKLELGLYLQAENYPGDVPGGVAPFTFDGVKQRARYRFADPGKWPVDVAVYLEFAELATEFEIEAKVNLERRFGRFAIMSNLWAEREFYYNTPDEWVINPTLGMTFEVHPILTLGLESWMHAEFGHPSITGSQGTATAAQFNNDPHEFVGPTAMLMFGRFWTSVGAYLRVDGINDAVPIGAIYGHFTVRTMLGVDL